MVLALRSVGKVYTRGKRLVVALDRVSMSVDGGDCVALYGSGRSGKSTLLRLAAGAELPTSGAVHYEGRDLNSLGEHGRSRLLRTEVAWLPASLDLQPGLSVLEQVALVAYLGSRDYARSTREARDALKMAGIWHCADAGTGELSDGERRLTTIAQAIVKRPRLLLADEPATNLDPAERDRVLDLLRTCAVERASAVLFSACHADETLGSTQLARLDSGRLTLPSVGPPQAAEVIDFASRRAAGDRPGA